MNVHVAASLEDALQFKRAHPSARPLLGGTDAIAQWQAGAARPDHVLALETIRELKQLEPGPGGLRIGAGVDHFTLAHHVAVRDRLPALATAARTVGAPAIQMMGTVAGNIANASPAADLAPALIAYGAEAIIASVDRERRVPLDRLFVGYRKIDLTPQELLVGVMVPWPPGGAFSEYHKVGTRAAQSIARVGVAGCITLGSRMVTRVTLAAASVAATPLRLVEAEQALTGRELTAELASHARDVAASSVSPIDDVRGTAAYRRRVLGLLVERFLLRAAELSAS
jgi:xanthine dehydrogenase FAD-binding subunit